jgi:hypothetical protein
MRLTPLVRCTALGMLLVPCSVSMSSAQTIGGRVHLRFAFESRSLDTEVGASFAFHVKITPYVVPDLQTTRTTIESLYIPRSRP